MPNNTPKRVLLYRMGSLGDHLVALPSYRLIARAFPDAERRLLTTVPVATVAATAQQVLDGMGLVHGYITYTANERNLFALLKLVWQIRCWKPDVAIHMTGPLKPVARDKKFLRLCGITKQIAVPLDPGAQLQQLDTRNLNGRPAPWYEQEGERLARVVGRELGDAHSEDPANWSLDLTADEQAKAASLLAPLNNAPFFAFSIGTKIQANEWGLERWARLLAALSHEWPGHALVLVGAQDEHKNSEAMAAAWRESGNATLNVCGASSPRVSAAVLAHAVSFFGQDSGPAHLAAAVGTPVFAIFSARNRPGEWRPRGPRHSIVLHWVDCGHCVLDTCIVQKKKCILSITVDEALLAVRQHLAALN